MCLWTRRLLCVFFQMNPDGLSLVSKRHVRQPARPPSGSILDKYRRPERFPLFQSVFDVEDFEQVLCLSSSIGEQISELLLTAIGNLDQDHQLQLENLGNAFIAGISLVQSLKDIWRSRTAYSDPVWSVDSHARCCLRIRQAVKTMLTLRNFGNVPGLYLLPDELMHLIFWVF